MGDTNDRRKRSKEHSGIVEERLKKDKRQSKSPLIPERQRPLQNDTLGTLLLFRRNL
jgi:hypothetical protein